MFYPGYNQTKNRNVLNLEGKIQESAVQFILLRKYSNAYYLLNLIGAHRNCINSNCSFLRHTTGEILSIYSMEKTSPTHKFTCIEFLNYLLENEQCNQFDREHILLKISLLYQELLKDTAIAIKVYPDSFFKKIFPKLTDASRQPDSNLIGDNIVTQLNEACTPEVGGELVTTEFMTQRSEYLYNHAKQCLIEAIASNGCGMTYAVYGHFLWREWSI